MKKLIGYDLFCRNAFKVVCAAALVFGVSVSSMADTIGFNPSTSNVGLGDSFSVDIVGDFTELAGGVIDLGFTSSVLQIDSVAINPYFDYFPDSGGPASGDTWSGIAFDTFVNNPASGSVTIATINLTALASGSGSLDVLGTSELYSATALLSPTPSSGTVNVSAVPVPAAMWLFGSALFGIAIVSRRKAA